MNLAIDIGNTFAKVGIFDQHRLIETREKLSLDEVSVLVAQYPPEHVIISDVTRKSETLSISVPGLLVRLDYLTPLPVHNLYGTPHTLGMDRLAAVAGAWSMFPDSANLVLDAGTCITYDFINRQAEYRGGSISPGMQMRFRALNHFTAKLPLLTPVEEPVPLTGTSTAGAIMSGVVNGMVYEIEGVIAAYREQADALGQQLQVSICGGDADFFEKRINTRIFADQKLLLTGLNTILRYNLQLNK